jgi:hypothetical protein
MGIKSFLVRNAVILFFLEIRTAIVYEIKLRTNFNNDLFSVT